MWWGIWWLYWFGTCTGGLGGCTGFGACGGGFCACSGSGTHAGGLGICPGREGGGGGFGICAGRFGNGGGLGMCRGGFVSRGFCVLFGGTWFCVWYIGTTIICGSNGGFCFGGFFFEDFSVKGLFPLLGQLLWFLWSFALEAVLVQTVLFLPYGIY